MLRVLAGFASSRPRRIRFVRVRGGAESMESLWIILWHETFLPLGTTQPVPRCSGVERRLRASAPRNRDGVRGRPPFWPSWRSHCAERGLHQAGCVAARPAAGCSRLQSFICCRPTIPQVWPDMSSADLEDRRAGTDGIHGILLLLGNERSKGKRRHPFHGRGRAAKGRSCGFFAFHSGFGLGARIARGCIRFFLDRDGQGSRWLNRASTLCSPSNIASKIIVVSTSSMRGRGALPFDQQNWDAPARPRIKRNCRAGRRGSHSSDSSNGKLN